MKFKKLFCVFLFAFFSHVSFANHMVGGEIYYDNLGGNNYKVTLKLYRDCLSAGAPFDSVANIFVFDAAGTYITSLDIVFPGSTTLPLTINSPCGATLPPVCVEEADYAGVINLPNSPGGYNLVYQRCCRNITILNIVNPGDVGSTYMAHIPDNTVPGNSSPRYTNFPPLFLCADFPLNFDHSATDSDGDSLYYELCDAYSGLDGLCPSLGPLALGGCPTIPSPPPYAFVPWQPGYSGTYPMSSSTPIAIDPVTGLLTGTPDMIGQWVVAICVSEFRGGVLIDVNKRDFQFNVVDCSAIPLAAIPAQTTFCAGYSVNFSQTSVNGVTYHWDFGDASTTADTSDLFSPTWTYANYGTYTVTLIVNSSAGCSDTATSVFTVSPLVDPTFTAPPGQCVYSNSFSFSGSGTFSGTATINWNFGTQATPSTSTSINPTNVVYNAPGTFPVLFTVSDNGCTKTDTNYVTVYPKPDAFYTLASNIACDLQPVCFIDGSTLAPLTYLWDFGDSTTSTQQNPCHIYDSIGTYFTNVIVSTAVGCKDTFYLSDVIDVFPSPTAGFSVSPQDTSITHPLVTTLDLSSGATTSTLFWGDGTSTSVMDTTHIYPAVGQYQLMQVVGNNYGCYDTAYSQVYIYPGYLFWLPNAFTPNGNGINEIFKPELFGVYDYSFMIFNRWGEKIFETKDTNVGWDGTYKSKLCEQDVYVYKIDFFDEVDLVSHQYIGGVTLLR